MKSNENLLLGATLAAMMAASPVFADQRCRSTDVSYTNKLDSLIVVYKMRYHDVEDSKSGEKKWRTEETPNYTLEPGDTSPESNQTLEYVGNEEIGGFQARYKPCDLAHPTDARVCLEWGDRTWSSTVKQGDIDRCVRDQEINIEVK